MFNSLFKSKDKDQQKAWEIYTKCVKEARNPVFYTEMGVPDTIDGRFEMIVLLVTLEMLSLQRDGDASKDLQQYLFDVMFADMDQSLRERGVGDHSVPKQMRRMMKGFNGRAHAYKAAMEKADYQELSEALERNVYGTAAPIEKKSLDALRAYVIKKYGQQEEQ